MTGVEWTVDRVVSVTDGDTLRVVRSRPVELDGHHYTLTDRAPKGVAVRLAWVNTPERGKDGWHQARADLGDWIAERVLVSSVDPRPFVGLHVVVLASGGWDRLLVDLRAASGESASQWLMTERGWPAYMK